VRKCRFALASIEYSSGPPPVRSENGQLVTYVSVDTTASDLGGYVQKAGEHLRQAVHARPASIGNGPERSSNCSRSRRVCSSSSVHVADYHPADLCEHTFVRETCIVLLAVPFSLVGAFWLLYLCGYQFSVAVAVGLIALAGIDAEPAS